MARILHVLTSPRAEGTPRLVLDWLTVASHEQGVVFLMEEPADLLDDFRKTNCWLHVKPGRLGRRLAKYPQVIGTVHRAVRRFRPDVVLAWPNGLAHLIHLGARTAGGARLLTHAGTAPGKTLYSRYLYNWLCFGVSRMCGHRVVACSEYVRQEFLSIPFLTRSHVVATHNCCRVGAFIPPPDAIRFPNRACMVGSLESSKDYPCLLKAWRLVEERGDFELVIAGGGSKMAEYKEQAVRLGLRKVTFLGVVRDIPSLLWTSRVFAFSARPEEGFGTVLIEALAAGSRVVASDVPGCREVLQAGKCGMLVVPGSPSSFADALIDALSRPAAPAEVAEARDYARGFSPEKMVSEYLRLSGHGRPAL